jgi:hypothetical protein
LTAVSFCRGRWGHRRNCDEEEPCRDEVVWVGKPRIAPPAVGRRGTSSSPSRVARPSSLDHASARPSASAQQKGRTHSEPKGQAGTDAHSDAHTDSDAHAYAHSDAHADAYANSDAHAYSDSDAHTDSDAYQLTAALYTA